MLGEAPVVVVIHESVGMSAWTQAVGDQLAADGLIATVPDFRPQETAARRAGRRLRRCRHRGDPFRKYLHTEGWTPG